MLKRSLIAAIGVAFSAFGASAAPVTFVFDMPAFQSGAFTGQTSELTIVADNGGTSIFNQSFLNSEITAFDLTLGATNLSLSAATADSISTIGSAVYITTDSNGFGFLDLSEDVSTRRSFSENGNLIQLGTTINGSGSIPYFVRIGDDFGFTNDRTALTQLQSTSVNGEPTTSAVPIPAPLALLLGSVAWFGYVRRRKSA